MTEIACHLRSIATGFLAGAFAMGTLGVTGSIGILNIESQVAMRKEMVARLRVLVPATMVGAILASGICAINSGRTEQGFGPWVVLICSAIVFLLSLTVHHPINSQILQWGKDEIPLNAATLLLQWNRADLWRMFFAVSAFLAAEWAQSP